MDAKDPGKSVEAAIRILEALQENDGMTVTGLSNILDLSKGTVHNHLSTLAANALVTTNGDEYQLGIRFFEFGEYVKRHQHIYDLGVPEVEKLAGETGELGNLLIEEHGKGIYLYRASGQQALTLDTGVGVRVSLHNTALGKAILANLPEKRVEEILDEHPLEATTENTITSREALYDELEDVRKSGIAYDLEERVIGVQCVAAPVITTDGHVLGAISIAGPTSRMKLENGSSDLTELVSNTADVISINATYG
jgi:DNA-binding IclR family transcriptional regulator